MQLSRSLIFLYGSFVCITWPTGIDSESFPLWSRTAFRLNVKQSINNRLSSVLHLRPFVEKKLVNFYSLLRKTEDFVFFLEDSIIEIWKQETLMLLGQNCLIQDYLIRLKFLNVFFNLLVHILYDNPYNLHPFLSPKLISALSSGFHDRVSQVQLTPHCVPPSQGRWQIWVFDRAFISWRVSRDMNAAKIWFSLNHGMSFFLKPGPEIHSRGWIKNMRSPTFALFTDFASKL
jgi:hypothetical protein